MCWRKGKGCFKFLYAGIQCWYNNKGQSEDTLKTCKDPVAVDKAPACWIHISKQDLKFQIVNFPFSGKQGKISKKCSDTFLKDDHAGCGENKHGTHCHCVVDG